MASTTRPDKRGKNTVPEHHQLFGSDTANTENLKVPLPPTVPPPSIFHDEGTYEKVLIEMPLDLPKSGEKSEQKITAQSIRAQRNAFSRVPAEPISKPPPTTIRSSVPPPPLERTHIGRYEVIYPLAAGGMASIHLGRLSGLAGFERLVAIKVIHPHLSTQEQFVNMFLDEARVAALIHHPNVGEILEVEEDDGLLYMVGELIVGKNLHAVFARAQKKGVVLSQALIADVLAKVCRGVHAAHNLKGPDNKLLKLVHRDISPRNIMISFDGDVKLIDFGIAHVQGRLSHTEAGSVKGKSGFVSPEHILGRELDRRSDVFSLGVTMYLLITGSLPFAGKNDAQRMVHVVNGTFPPPGKLNPKVHPEMDRIVIKAMQREPDDRYQSAAELAYDLEGFVSLQGHGDYTSELSELMHGFFEADINQHSDILKKHRERIGEGSGLIHPPQTRNTTIINGKKKKEANNEKGNSVEQPTVVARKTVDNADNADNADDADDALSQYTAAMSTDMKKSLLALSKKENKASNKNENTRKLKAAIFLLSTLVLTLLVGLSLVWAGFFSVHFPLTKEAVPLPTTSEKTIGAQSTSTTDLKAPATPTLKDPPPVAAPTSRSIRISLEVSPIDYFVYVDDKPFGPNLSELEIPADEKQHTVQIKKIGFQPFTAAILANEDKKITAKLLRKDTTWKKTQNIKIKTKKTAKDPTLEGNPYQ